jgi:hypothetical protein
MHMPICLGIFPMQNVLRTPNAFEQCHEQRKSVMPFPMFIPPENHTITHTRKTARHQLALTSTVDCVLALSFRQLHSHPLIADDTAPNAALVE